MNKSGDNSKSRLIKYIEKHNSLFIDLLTKPYEYEETNLLLNFGFL